MHSVNFILKGSAISVSFCFNTEVEAARLFNRVSPLVGAKDKERASQMQLVRDDFGRVCSIDMETVACVLETDIKEGLESDAKVAILQAKAQAAAQNAMRSDISLSMAGSGAGIIHQ